MRKNGATQKDKLISVILPVYNAERFISLAFESVLRQTHEKFEVIAIDDGSSDDSLVILEEFAKRDPRVRIISRENKGLVATLNEGLDLARGDFIARMDADDICYPERFALQLQAFAADPNLTVCGMNVDILRSNNRVAVQEPHALSWQEVRVLNVFGPALFHPVVMFRRDHFLRHGFRYSSDYRHAEDFDLIRRVTRVCRAEALPHKGLIYRDQGHGNVSSVHREEQTRTHLKIVSEQLQCFGIVVPREPLEKLASSSPVVEGDVELLSEFFRALWAYDGFSGAERGAFELGTSRLLWQVHSLLTERVDAYHALKMVRETGIIERMPRRFVLTSLLARVVGGKSALRVGAIASLVDDWRTYSLDRILSPTEPRE
jgi:glycosyltransferase involved in cell wall biosynthesis